MASPSANALLKWAQAASRGFAAAAGSAPGRKVAVLGAAGGIGQPLSMLMKVRRRQSAAASGYASRE
jgi:malate dehydrogenase